MSSTYQQKSKTPNDEDATTDKKTPGPGAYYNHRQTTFLVQSKPEQL